MKRILLIFGILSCWTSNAQIVAPFTESFDNSAIPTGWSNTSTNTGTNAQWKFSGTPGNPNMGSSASYVPAVILDHTGNSGGIAWSDGSTPQVADCGLLTDSIDVSALTSPYLEFWYYSNNVGLPADGNNTLLVNFYDGSQWNNSIWTYSGNGTAWQYAGLDLSAYTITGNVLFEIVLDQTTSGSGFYNDVLIDDISVITAPPCPLPLGLAANNVTATTADMTWNASTSAVGWDIIWGTSGFDPATGGSSATVTSASHNITSLTGNTIYDAYLVADCGTTNGLSDTLGPISFRTACVAEVIGYNNGFENDPSNSSPVCWTNYISNTSASVTIITFSTPYLGSQHLRLTSGFAGNTDTTTIASPQLSGLTSGLNQIRFFAQTDDIVEELIIGTVSDPTNPGSFSALDTVRFASTFNYEEIIIPITTANGYNGTDEYIVFKHSMNNTFNGLFIDEFNYEVIPPCPKITGIALNSVTDSSAAFGFNSSGSTVGFEWGPTGFAQGTGTTDSISANPLIIQGLTGNTTYDIYLRNDCSQSGNGTSVWTGPFTFTTACNPFTAPYTNSFDLTTAPTLDNCWTPVNMTNVTFSEVGTDAFRNFSAPNSMELHNSSGITGFLGVASPNFSDLDSNKRIQFMAYDEDGSFDGSDLIIGTMSNPSDTSTFTAWDTITEADMDDDVWELFIVSFEGYTGTDNYIVFKHGLNSTFDNIHIDDFVYEVLPSCIGSIVTSLSGDSIRSTSATASWAGGQGTTTIIEWGTTGFVPGIGANLGLGTVPGTDSTFNITGLSSNTTYDFYIQDTCLVGGKGAWIGPLTFKTKCIISAATLPFFDGFETYAVGPYQGYADFCNPSYTWEFEPTVAEGRLRFAAGIGFQKTGTQALTLDNSAFVFPETSNFLTLNIDLTNYTSAAGIELGFSVLATAQEANLDNRVWARGSLSDPWIEVVNLDNVGVNGTFVDVANIDIVAPLASASQTVGSETQIRFGQSGQGSAFALTFSDGYTFDDVTLTEVTCPTPSGLTAHSIVDTSATIAWNTSGSASGYEVWFGPGGFFQGTQTVSTGSVKVNTTTGSILIDTLSSNTCYEYLVRYICGAGDTSIWQGPYTYCTPCSTAPIPYLEPYDVWPVACWDVSLGGEDWTVYNGPLGDNYAEARFWSFNNTDMIMRSRPINITQDAWVRFDWSHLYSATYPFDELIVRAQVIGSSNWDTLVDLIGQTDFNDPTAGNTVPGSFITNTTVLDPLIYTGSTAVFELIANSDFGPDLFINDFAVEKIPTCFEPTNAVAVNIGFDDAELRWDLGAIGQSGNYQVSYGAGITAASAGTMSMISVDSLLLTGLTSNTNYCYYVREICGAGDSSNWTGPVCFSTECTALTAPFNEDFENSTLGHFAGKDNCWTMTNSNQALTSNTAGYSWELRNVVQTSSGGTGASGDHTLYPAIGGQFYNADVSYGATGDSSALTSPIIDITPLTNPELEYHYHRFGNNMAELHLDVFDGSNWIRGVHSFTSLAGAQTSNADAWSDTILDLTPYMSVTNFQVRFRTVSNGCCAGDNGLDDIRISDPLSCINPQNLAVSGITATDATLLWDSGAAGQSGNFEVSYGLNLNDPLLGTTAVTASADSLVLNTLSSSSKYCFYVREICAVGDTSFWTGPFCFNTLCVAVMAPISEDFENHTLGFFQGDDNCWTIINTNQNMAANTNGYSWELRNAVQTSSGGTGSVGDRTLFPAIGGQFFNADVSYGATPDTSVLQSPIIDITGLTNPEVAYSLHRFGNNMGEFYVDVFDGTNWVRGVHSYTSLNGAQGSGAAAWTDTAVSITAYAGITNFQVRFRTVTNGCCAGDNGLDDIHIRTGSACPDPSSLDTVNVACNAADLLWNSPSSTLTSDIEWGASGFAPGTGTSVVGATSPSAITGLSATTAYQFYVRDYCATDTSNWVGPFSFTTPACPAGCVDPNGLDTANASCTSTDLIWSSTSTTLTSAIEWGAAGFTPGGGGTIVPGASSPESLSGLTPGASYEFYVVDFCLTDTSSVVGPFAFTLPSGPISAAFTEVINAPTLNDQTVDFDASTSVGATSYAWDFGDGTTGTGVSPSHVYTANSSFDVKLVITGDCGIDSVTNSILTAGISLTENKLGRSLEIYPNPTNGIVKVNFNAYNSNNAVISLTDLTGKVIRSTNVSVPDGKYEGELNIRDLARGSYILKIESGDLSVQRRVIKQ